MYINKKSAKETSVFVYAKYGLTLSIFCCSLLLYANFSFADSSKRWAEMAAAGTVHDFRQIKFTVPPFYLSGLIKGNSSSNENLMVYIEGDGLVKTNSGNTTRDPSPIQPLAYELSLLDPASKILYLARPGQFQSENTSMPPKKYWTNARYAPEVIDAMDQAIDQAKKSLNAEYIHLTGFSGGAAIATLLAESRNDVKTLTTVAGLLDTDWWTTSNNYTPLTGSLNPATSAYTIANLPQIHFAGLHDTIISPLMPIRFKAHMPAATNIIIETQPCGHHDGWVSNWPLLLTEYILPMRSKND